MTKKSHTSYPIYVQKLNIAKNFEWNHNRSSMDTGSDQLAQCFKLCLNSSHIIFNFIIKFIATFIRKCRNRAKCVGFKKLREFKCKILSKGKRTE
ncbi:hypothetical protein JHK87_023381 [Glycine soja]|uniref:Uncharacterized protein n=1 Tax=Glycine max TaxID=3847 RepID=A0A0R0J494_SOYBN|nr:hypothetical protein JHK87_023381 [Glycine soja]